MTWHQWFDLQLKSIEVGILWLVVVVGGYLLFLRWLKRHPR